jgi:pyruvate kinase
MDRKAKIIATLGPSTDDDQIMRHLILSGLDVARLNFSHGTYSQHAEQMARLRRISAEIGKPVSILQDLQGPKLRVGNLPTEGISLTSGEFVTLSDSTNAASFSAIDGKHIPVEIPDLLKVVEPGKRILMDDGHLELNIVEVTRTAIKAKVIVGGILLSHKGVNLPGAKLNIPGFTEKDRLDLEFGLNQDVDYIAMSFVRTYKDIEIVRDAIKQIAPHKSNTPIIAKLERPEAIQNISSILEIADGVMVARGDLAVETSPASVPVLQKSIIQEANRKLKLVITATQMLESMVKDPRPTRAEASDVANAIFDGSDAVMLSAETAVGKYPVETVQMMSSIIQEAENNYLKWGQCQVITQDDTTDDAVSMTHAARELAHDRDVEAIAVFTQTGRTAILMSKARPQVPIIALTPEKTTYQRLNMFWGVKPLLIPLATTLENMVKTVEDYLLNTGFIKTGTQVVIISGFPVGAMRQPNLALLYTIGQ